MVKNNKSAFNAAAAIIGSAFIEPVNMKNYQYKVDFLKGKLVAKFCDCAKCFEQKKLVKLFEKKNSIFYYKNVVNKLKEKK